MTESPNTFQEIYAIPPKAIHDIIRNSERNCVKTSWYLGSKSSVHVEKHPLQIHFMHLDKETS
jgi:hypothetical protein